MPFMEYTAEILRGWPADGARERTELVKAGVALVNGDFVEIQADGTVDKVSATKTKRAGLVIRGNTPATSGGNANGLTMTPAPTKAVAIGAATSSGTVATIAIAGHGYQPGNVVTIAGVTPAGYNGTVVVSSIAADGNSFTYTLPSGASGLAASTVAGTAQLLTRQLSSNGKALVLWGNYIAKISQAQVTMSGLTPGAAVCVASNKLAAATIGTDPELGFVLSIQGVNPVGGNLAGNETAHVVFVAY